MQPRKQNGGASKGDRTELGVYSGKFVCPCRHYGTSKSPNMGPEIDERRAKKKIVRRVLRVFLWSNEELNKHTTTLKAFT